MMNGMTDILFISSVTVIICGVLTLLFLVLEHYFSKHMPVGFFYRYICVVLLLYGISVIYILVRLVRYVFNQPMVGILGIETPIIQIISLPIVFVWLVGLLYKLIRQIMNIHSLRVICRNRMLVPRHYREVLKQVGEEMGIKREIDVHYCYRAKTAFISGLRKPAIYLPVEDICDEELRMLFMHELRHYKQGDIPFKFISIMLCSLYWFWPPIYFLKYCYNLFAEIGNDSYCMKRIEDGRNYLSFLAKFADRANSDNNTLAPAWIEKTSDISGRMRQLKKYSRKKTKISLAALLTAFALFVTSITAYGATTSLKYAYNQTWSKTMTGVQEELESTQELKEYEGTIADLEGLTVVEEEGPVARTGEHLIACKVSNHGYYRSPIFTKTAGSTIRVNVDVTPTNKEVTVGIVKPDGTTIYVKGKGTIAHTFTTPMSGNHQVFVANYSGVTVSLSGYYK